MNCTDKDLECPKAREVADAAVKQVFAILGVNIDVPSDVAEFQMDLRFGRSMRRATDKGFMAMVVIVAAGIAGAVWLGLVAKVKGG